MGTIAPFTPADPAPLSDPDLTGPGSGPPDGAPSDLDFDPVSVAYRSDGWTPATQRAFIEALAECGIVGEAAARVGMSEQSARQLRRRPDGRSFSLAWGAAIVLGADRLRSVAFDRAVNGTVRRRYYHGKVIDEERTYDNRLLTYLLGKLPSRRAYDDMDWGEVMASVELGLPLKVSLDEDDDGPVWSEDGRWLTSFPPPAGFAGEEEGRYGDEDYARELSQEEQAIVDASLARRRDKDDRTRDAFFGRLK